MARRRRNNSSDIGILGLLGLGVIVLIIEAVIKLVTVIAAPLADLFSNEMQKESFGEKRISKQRNKLLNEILSELHLDENSLISNEYDDEKIVKSERSFNDS